MFCVNLKMNAHLLTVKQCGNMKAIIFSIFQSSFRWDSDTVLVLFASSALLAPSQPVH